jgi:hypothetical protein
VLTGHVQRLPAGSEHRHPGRFAEQCADQRRAPADHVLARVKHQQHLTAAQVLDHRVRFSPGVLLRQPEARGDRVRNEVEVPQLAQLHKTDAIGEPPARVGRGPARHAGLSDAGRTSDGDQPGRLQQGGQRVQLPAAANKAGHLSGQLTGVPLH